MLHQGIHLRGIGAGPGLQFRQFLLVGLLPFRLSLGQLRWAGARGSRGLEGLLH